MNKIYYLPRFPSSLKDNVTQKHLKVLEYFEKYPLINKLSPITMIMPYSIIYLKQQHFNYGTIRLRKPGIYILTEDIIFEPNKANNFFPTIVQISSGLYPMGNKGAYHLGFFAAITVEADNIILDLNGKTIKQSKLHNLQQRFYANIELASAPFIPSEGPASFGDSIVMPTNTLIMNGTLGLSSHHGIHGNGMKNTVIYNITAENMEVAAIALNGGVNSILYDINVVKIAKEIHVLSTYSQGLFIKSFLNNLQRRNQEALLKLSTGDKKISDIIRELNLQLEKTKKYILKNNKAPYNIFGNASKLYDGNVYGIVLNIRGVVVNGFITKRTHSSLGNQNIHLEDIFINNIVSQPLEIIAINSAPEEDIAYQGKRMVGPVGDVFHISLATYKNKYKQNVLANAQLILAKYNDPPNGTTNIEEPIVEWAEKQTDLTKVFEEQGYYYVDRGDSMGHTMKGNIGLFISCGLDITMNNIYINVVYASGKSVGTSSLIRRSNKQGAAAIGIMITGSKNITMNNVEIKNVISDNGKAKDIEILSSTNIINNT